MCRVREINIKNRTHYLFYDMIDIKNEIKTDERSYKNILLYYIAYVTLNNVKPFYLIINKINGYIKEHMGIIIWHYFILMKGKTH